MKYISPLNFYLRAMPTNNMKLVKYGRKLGKYITVGVDNVTSPDRPSELLLMPPITKLFNKAREIYGAPLMITAGDRTIEHQRRLLKMGLKAATIMSPHILGAALDIDAKPNRLRGRSEVDECLYIVRCLEKAAGVLKLGLPRIGIKVYNHRFVHVDLVYMLFKPWTLVPHPSDWPETFKDLRGQVVKGAHEKFDRSWRPGVTW